MDDKEFDKLLYMSLRPDVTDEETTFKHYKEGQKKMKPSHIIKPLVATAACATLILGVSRLPDIAHIGAPVSTDPLTGTASSGAGIMEQVEDSFTIHAFAAGHKKKELKKNISIPTTHSQDGLYGGIDDTLETCYTNSFPISCEGKNIEKITYSINKGAFQIIHKKGDNFLLDGEKYKGDMNVGVLTPRNYNDGDEVEKPSKDTEEDAGGITATINENNDGEFPGNAGDYDAGYYTSFTISPQLQSSDDISVAICDNKVLPKNTYKKIWGWDYNDSDINRSSRVDTLCGGMNELYKDVIITCKVTFKDGSVQTKKISVDATVMTAAEAEDDITSEKSGSSVESVYTTYTVVE